MGKAEDQVKAFLAACSENGFTPSVSGGCVRISLSFGAGDSQAFAAADMTAGSVLGLAHLKGGSVWGTDGGSVGGYAALKSGSFCMNKSGSGSNFIKALKKTLGAV